MSVKRTTVVDRFRGILSARRLLAVAISLISFLILFAIDHAEEKSCTDEPSSPWYRKVLSCGFWYQVSVTNAGLNKPENSHVALVLIEDPVIIANACLKRSFLASLLRTLDDIRANTIVLDMVVSADRCPEGKGNDDLVGALHQAQAHLVFGQSALAQEDLLPADIEALKSKHFIDTDLILKPTFFSVDPRMRHLLDLDNKNPGEIPRVTTGLVTLDQDNRRIPLRWYAFPDKQSVGVTPPVWTETLAVAAVRATNRDHPFLRDLSGLENSGDPFTSFLRQDQFIEKSAEEIVCSGSHRDNLGSWNCPARSDTTEASRDLSNRVLVIGQVDPEQNLDMQESVVGRVPGVVLQANYIEALLSLRYLRRIPAFMELLIALTWFWVIDLIFKKFADYPLKALAISALANMLVWLLIYNFVVVELRRYISMLVPSFLMIVGRVIWTSDVQEHMHHSASDPSKGTSISSA